MEDYFEKFMREQEYVNNLAHNTLKSYRNSFKVWQRFKGNYSDDGLIDFVIEMRKSGLKPGACNVYIRSLNVFFHWLHEKGLVKERLTLRVMRKEQNIIPIFTDEHIKKILHFRPKSFYEWRMWAICNTLLDTGMRVSECLALKRPDVDWDNLLLTIIVKGRRQRKVPFSYELRKVLHQYLQRREGINLNGEWLFPTVSSMKIGYRNFHRDMVIFCQKLRITGVRISPHSFRHYFASNFVRQGGDVYTLSRLLGHSSVKVTEIYLQSLGVEYLQNSQMRFTPLSRR